MKNIKKIISLNAVFLGVLIIAFSFFSSEENFLKEEVLTAKNEIKDAEEVSYKDWNEAKSEATLQNTSKEIKPSFVSKQELVLANIRLSGKDYSVSFEKGETLHEGMLSLMNQDQISFKGKQYSGLGFFIEEINGVKQGNGKYWILYVNGKNSDVGVSDYKLKEGDKIEWKLEESIN